VYRILVDGLFGLKGERDGLRVAPRLPSDWSEVSVKRSFRGAELHVSIKRDKGLATQEVYVDGELAEDGLLAHLESGKHYEVLVKIPG
jgi:cellobionic acid phosphorylase